VPKFVQTEARNRAVPGKVLQSDSIVNGSH